MTSPGIIAKQDAEANQVWLGLDKEIEPIVNGIATQTQNKPLLAEEHRNIGQLIEGCKEEALKQRLVNLKRRYPSLIDHHQHFVGLIVDAHNAGLHGGDHVCKSELCTDMPTATMGANTEVVQKKSEELVI